ncbi:hypothetical protein H7097_00640 [Aeromicrobium sp.]|nr:hypothetical protein [Candidatus Saccharibacteria bacterium]
MELSQPSTADAVHVVGFAMPFALNGEFDSHSHTVTPITNLVEVPKQFQTIDIQGKGVGPRLFNTLPAACSMKWHPAIIGVYAVQLQAESLPDGSGN